METSRWNCPSCNDAVLTPFCARCGEEPLSQRDLTLRGLAENLVQALSSIDARVLRTTRRLLRQPGELTREWSIGVRKPYVAPFQLFLIANVIFFAVQSLTGEIVFSSPLDSHLHHQDWSELAQSLLAGRLEAKHLSIEAYAPMFDSAVALNAKSLIGLMAVPFTLLLPLAFWRAGRPFMTHVTFALHLYTFLLLLFSIGMLIAKLAALGGFGGLESFVVDKALTVANLTACIWYIYRAIGPVYAASGIPRMLQAIALSLAVAAIVLGYRFGLFIFTLYST
jgi:hypothetical protein